MSEETRDRFDAKRTLESIKIRPTTSPWGLIALLIEILKDQESRLSALETARHNQPPN